MPTRRHAILGMAAVTMGSVRQGQAQAAWPQRAVRVIVPFPAGTTPDLSARPVATHFQNVFGQPFVVENRSGAGGTIGVAALAAANDGHTIGLANNGTVATAKAMFPNLPYDPERDLRPIALLSITPLVLALGPSARARTVPEFVARARAEPGKMSYASVGVGSAGHLTMEEFMQGTGIRLEHVPYRGFPEAVIDLVAGRIEAMISPVTNVLAASREGQAFIAATCSERRLPQIPDVPIMQETGAPPLVSIGWNGLFAPSSLDRALLPRLGEEACKALADPRTRASFDAAGLVMDCGSTERFTSFVAAETERWTGMIRRLNIRPAG